MPIDSSQEDIYAAMAGGDAADGANPDPTGSLATFTPAPVQGIAQTSVGGNVGGVVGMAPPSDQYETSIPDPIDRVEEDTEDFEEADVEGFTDKDGKFFEAGKKAARKQKKETRQNDQQARRDVKEALGGKEGRKAKRAMRKQRKAERKAAWKTYKGNKKMGDAETSEAYMDAYY
tara:strand:- start:7 stop:531 length:525 start_codon:yes stop_codon:yes gene_type:complete